MEGLQRVRGNPQTFVGWGGGLGIRLDSKANIPGEKGDGWRAEAAVLRWVHSGLRAQVVARVLSSPRRRGGGEEGAGAERMLSSSMCLGLHHERWTCQKELPAENWQRACEFPPQKSLAVGKGAG